MAFVPKQLPQDEENQFGRTEPSTPNPAPQAGGGSAGTGQGGAAPGVGTPTQFGSNAAKLTDYLNANKEQVGEFGNKIAGKLGEQYGEARGAVDQGFQGYNQAVNQGYAQNDQDLVNQAVSNPTDFVKDENNFNKFESLYNNQYKGPENVQSYQPYQDINGKVNSAVQNAGLTNNFSGLSTYLNNFMGTGTNSQGVNSLDTALLQRSPEARETIKNAATPFGGLTDYLGNKVSEGNAAAASAKDTANQIKDQTRGALSGATDAFQNDLANRVQQAQGKVGASSQEISNILGNTEANPQQRQSLTPEQLADLGVNPEDYKALQGSQWLLQQAYNTPFSASNYFTPNMPGSINAQNLANPEEYAKEAALQKLSGGTFDYLPEDASQAGTAKTSAGTFQGTQAATEAKNQVRQKDVESIQNDPPSDVLFNFLRNGQQAPEQIQVKASQDAGKLNRMLIENGNSTRNLVGDGAYNWMISYNNAFPNQVIKLSDGSSKQMTWNPETQKWGEASASSPGGGGTAGPGNPGNGVIHAS